MSGAGLGFWESDPIRINGEQLDRLVYVHRDSRGRTCMLEVLQTLQAPERSARFEQMPAECAGCYRIRFCRVRKVAGGYIPVGEGTVHADSFDCLDRAKDVAVRLASLYCSIMTQAQQ